MTSDLQEYKMTAVEIIRRVSNYFASGIACSMGALTSTGNTLTHTHQGTERTLAEWVTSPARPSVLHLYLTAIGPRDTWHMVDVIFKTLGLRVPAEIIQDELFWRGRLVPAGTRVEVEIINIGVQHEP